MQVCKRSRANPLSPATAKPQLRRDDTLLKFCCPQRYQAPWNSRNSVRIMPVTSDGAKGTRTPGLLHAMGRAAVHSSATCLPEKRNAAQCRASLTDDGQIPVGTILQSGRDHMITSCRFWRDDASCP